MQISVEAGFRRSLFERLVLLGHEKHLLNVQYRVHPSISRFPNMEFYDKQILDSPNVEERSHEKHFLHGDMFKFYSFINVAYGQDEFDEGNSRKNMVEVAVVSEIVLNLYKESASSKQTVSVGVISPYKAQVSTVDGFQGGKEDVRCNNMGWHNADKDERLSDATATSVIELGQVNDLLNLNSLLFKKAKWKICFNQGFLISMARIKSTEICKKICFLLMQLSSGWHQPHQEINTRAVDGTSQQLELYKVNESLYLAWTIDVLEENSNNV
ncbi:Putative regulator of nonsense transcripts 1 [Glycine soja]|uniref:Putative regulator of nonsense transcripts 1 n=1 Tax=Glycine soja TaxID=3848 RepID=A0A0B2Q587_GLYSO|nr:Putative regulator of nonsense transcripts 1 [Glycine soja]